LKEGKNLLLVLDTQGALRVKELFPEAVLIFILPPSLKELERRLRKRGADGEEVIACRLKEAEREMEKAELYDFVVVNDDLEGAFKELREIVREITENEEEEEEGYEPL
jgi:guanylate kinase